MKNLISILILIFVLKFSASGQTESDIHGFFDWRTNSQFQPNQVKIKRVCDSIKQWNSLDSMFLMLSSTNELLFYIDSAKYKLLDSILNPGNKQFISKQLNEYKTTYTWKKKDFPKQKLVKSKPLNEITNDAYLEFSVPLFTDDKKYCFIKESYLCGPLCMNSRTLLYKKTEDGKWKLIMNIWGVVS